MRAEVRVTIEGDSLAEGAVGTGELARILLSAAVAADVGRVVNLGDSVDLTDYNGHVVGRLALVPDGWSVHEEVWYLERQCYVTSVQQFQHDDEFYRVELRDSLTQEPRATILVDVEGRNPMGAPLIGRVRP